MSFLYPSFLFALAAIAIPIVIHLFHFRRFKTVYFSNVSFLKEVKEETASRSKLKHLLTLIARILAITFLVLAFAQPYIPKEDTEVVKGSRAVSIYVDNSFSMDAVGNNLSLLESAKEKAMEVANAYGPEDQFQLLTNDFEGKHQRLVDKETFRNFLNEVEISPAVKTLEQVQERQLNALGNAENKINYIISDFQKNIVNIEADTTLRTILVPIKAGQQNNIAIDSLWMEAPVQLVNQESKIFVKILNNSDEPVENSSLNLSINNVTKALSDFSVPANSSVIDTINFTATQTGWNKAELSINDYPITFDDNYFLTFFVPDKIDLLVINKATPDPYFTALSNESFLKVNHQAYTNISYSDFNNYELIILNQVPEIATGLAGELEGYIKNGGNVLVFPAPEADLPSYNRFLTSVNSSTYGGIVTKDQPVAYINMDQGLYEDVFDELPQNILLPKVNKFYSINRQTRSVEQSLIKLKDGSALLNKYTFDNGAVYVATVPPDLAFSDLPKHTLFVVTVVQIALTGNNNTRTFYTIGADNAISIRNLLKTNDQIYKIRNEQQEFIPEQRAVGSNVLLNVNDQVERSGFYEIILPEEGYNSFIAYNYDRKESKTSSFTAEELADRFRGTGINVIENTEADLSTAITEINEGIRLWKLCVIFALIFLAIEVLLLRFYPAQGKKISYT